jgi:hypothetical protein
MKWPLNKPNFDHSGVCMKSNVLFSTFSWIVICFAALTLSACGAFIEAKSVVDGELDISKAGAKDEPGYSLVAKCMGTSTSNRSHYQVVEVFVSKTDDKKFLAHLSVSSKINPSQQMSKIDSYPYFIVARAEVEKIEAADAPMIGALADMATAFVPYNKSFGVYFDVSKSKAILISEPGAIVNRRVSRSFDCRAKSMSVID